MSEELMRFRIREIILGMEKPFCIVNLLIRLEKENITDRRLILSVLDELFEEGMILYDEVEGSVEDPHASKWAFVVA